MRNKKVRAILQKEQKQQKYGVKSKRFQKPKKQQSESDSLSDITDVSSSEDFSAEEFNSDGQGLDQDSDYDRNLLSSESAMSGDGSDGDDHSTADISDGTEDELGSIAYPSSEDEPDTIQSIISGKDVSAWKEELGETQSIQEAISLIKTIISSWVRITVTQYQGSAISNKKQKKVMPLKKTLIESEKAELALYSLVFDDIFGKYLWEKLGQKDTTLPPQAYPAEMKPLKSTLKSFVAALPLIFNCCAFGSWMQVTIINAMDKMLPFLAAFPIPFANLLKTLISKIWIHPVSDMDSIADVLDGVHHLLKIVSHQYLGFSAKIIMKHCYDLWIKSIFDMSPTKHAHASRLSGFLCEIFFSLSDVQKQYDFAFISLRTLALSVRLESTSSSTKSTTKKNFAVSQGNLASIPAGSWAFVYAVRFWSRVIGAVVNETAEQSSPLRLLKFPLCQIIAAEIMYCGQSPRDIPLQIHLLDCAISLLQVGTGFTMETLLRILKQVIVSIKPPQRKERKPADPALLDWTSLLKVPQDAVSATWYWDLVGRRSSYLLLKCVLIHSSRADFPDVFGLPARWVLSAFIPFRSKAG